MAGYFNMRNTPLLVYYSVKYDNLNLAIFAYEEYGTIEYYSSET